MSVPKPHHTHHDSKVINPFRQVNSPIQIPNHTASAHQPSWFALLASTTLGAQSGFARVMVQSTSWPLLASTSEPMRVIVQVYSRRSLRHGRLLPWARPIASAQRAAHRDTLETGLPVLLTGFGRACAGPQDRLVAVAWLEPGYPTLDVDGAEARPAWNSCIGITSLCPIECPGMCAGQCMESGVWERSATITLRPSLARTIPDCSSRCCSGRSDSRESSPVSTIPVSTMSVSTMSARVSSGQSTYPPGVLLDSPINCSIQPSCFRRSRSHAPCELAQ